MLNCYRMEYEAVKKITPHIPVTTNLMGFYKPLDYQKWAKYMDFVSWDNYPSYSDSIARNALNHDMIRGLKGGKSFILMEQTPSVTNWQSYTALKRPGELRLQSYQAVAHGADSIMFFQMRRSIGACEKYHGAVIDHCGHENTRVFRELTQIGEELEVIGDRILGARGDAKVAIVFDWDNWWAIEYSAGPSIEMKYHDEILHYYTALHNQNIATDIIGVDDDLSRYEIVIAPILYMTKGDYHEKIQRYVKSGGTFVTTYFSGYVDENDLVITGGYPGKLRDILGIWVEESDALPPEFCNHFTYQGVEYPCKLLCDLMHLEGAESLTEYQEDFYAGMPVITKNPLGSGSAYYVGTQSSEAFYDRFVADLVKEKNVMPEADVPKGVEAVIRENGENQFLFLLNHTLEEQNIAIERDCKEVLTGQSYRKGETITLVKRGVAILQQ